MFESELVSALPYAKSAVARMLYRFPLDVEDVLQDAAVRAWAGKGSFRGECKFSTWFVQIAIRQALMFLRHKRRKVSGALPIEEAWGVWDPALGPGELVAASDFKRVVMEEVGKLTPGLRNEIGVLLWEDLEGKRADRNSHSRKSNRFRMRGKLAKRLAKRGIHVAGY